MMFFGQFFQSAHVLRISHRTTHINMTLANLEIRSNDTRPVQ